MTIDRCCDPVRFQAFGNEGFTVREGETVIGQVGFGVQDGRFWCYEWVCAQDRHAAAVLSQALRQEARSGGFTHVWGWLFPGSPVWKMMAKQRMKIEYVAVSVEA